MSIEEFKNLNQPKADFSSELKALWWDYQGDWNKAHGFVDELSGKTAAHVHAYLHRKEGDLWNADYWYRRAGESRPNETLEVEWEALVGKFLNLSNQ